MAFKRSFSPVLDGGLVNIGDGTVRRQSVRIESGEYTPPIWLRTDAGLVVPVGSLPFRGVLDAGRLEVLSEAPSGGEPPAGVVFHSDWSTATGTSDAALLDMNKAPLAWSARKDTNGGTAIVTAASTGRSWPAGMTNVMQITAQAEGGTQGVRNSGRFTAPGVGDAVIWRTYFSMEQPDSWSGGIQYHPFQDGGAGGGSDRNWAFRVYPHSNGTWSPELFIDSVDDVYGPGAQIQAWELGDNGILSLSKQVPYIIEVRMYVVDANSMRPAARILNGDGSPLYDESDFFRKGGGGGNDTLADGHTFEISSLAGMTSLQAGSNNWDQAPPQDTLAAYWGGLAIAVGGEDDWIGPYSGGV